jgi:hypothetical protein
MGDPHRQLTEVLERCAWFCSALNALRDAGPPDAWIGGGVIRDIVWGHIFGEGCSLDEVNDIDVAFFDPTDLSAKNDAAVTRGLNAQDPQFPWQAKNQAAVHLWYRARFGGDPVRPFRSIGEAAASWPETATSIAVRRATTGGIEICAPLGLEDLLNGVWRRNPERVTLAVSRERLDRQQPATRWPGVLVVPPATN